MAIRVTTSEVRTTADIAEEHSSAVSMSIRVANAVVEDHLVGLGVHSAEMLRSIELYLACHFSLLSVEKGPYSAIKVGEAREDFHNIYGAGFKATRFGQQALLLDSTGTLAALSAKASMPKLKATFEHIETEPYTGSDNI